MQRRVPCATSENIQKSETRKKGDTEDLRHNREREIDLISRKVWWKMKNDDTKGESNIATVVEDFFSSET